MHFRCLGRDITYDVDCDVDHKLVTTYHKLITICQTLSRKTSKEIRLKFYKLMAVVWLVLVYNSETLGSKKHLIRIQAS